MGKKLQNSQCPLFFSSVTTWSNVFCRSIYLAQYLPIKEQSAVQSSVNDTPRRDGVKKWPQLSLTINLHLG